jgi:DNA-binding transcriptional LysR family regulator
MNFGIDYRYLKAFQITAEYLNFSKAATKLNIAQSAVSRQIKLLEESMGEQLIIRSSKKVILTDKGKDLLGAITQFEKVTDNLIHTSSSKLIKIGILHGLLETWFLKVIKEFSKKSIHELKVESDTPLNLKNDLLEGKVDLIFTTENIQSDLITSLCLFDEDLVIISKKEIDLKKIEQYRWITYSDTDFILALYKKHSDQILTVKSMTSIIKLVKEGVGIAVVPSHTIIDQRLKTYPVKSQNKPQVFLSTLNYTSYPEHLKEILNIIKSHLP